LCPRLLTQADTLAQAGQWVEAFEHLTQAHALRPRHTGTVNGLGTCLLRLGRPLEARPYFQQASELAPTQPEAQNNLGVAFASSGDGALAEAAYQCALALDPDHQPAWRNLAQLRLQQGQWGEGAMMLAAVVQAHPDDIEALILLAGCYEQGEQPDSARFLYQRVLSADPHNSTAATALGRLALAPVAPAPAAPTPTAPAKTTHVAKLAAFRARPPVAPAAAAPVTSVVFYCTNEVSAGIRVGVPAEGLRAAGWTVKVPARFDPADLQAPDLVVLLRPNLSAGLMDVLAAATRAGRRVVVDLDDDFYGMLSDHPGYAAVGPGNPEAMRRLEQALAAADLVTVATPVLAERYGPLARRVAVIPNGWSHSNPLWDKPTPLRRTVNVGWAGTPTHSQDLTLVRRDLIRLMREVPEVQLVVAGDPDLFAAFSAIPETRRMFVPMMPFADYPSTLAYFDILIAPLRDTAFNRAKSDIKLLEAGIRRIPWVASDLPAYHAWGEGGLLVTGDWHTALAQLTADPALRATLGAAGRAKAETREAGAITAVWRAAMAPLLAPGTVA
jgi:Flp pilus assembly protein TadD/glycosyltransferase involved in cell wall biosynthesis